eukprot:PITA_16689
MLFGLMNAGATFQRAMDFAFADELGRFIVIYLHDITLFSKTNEEHLLHLRRVFEKCRKFGLSLNPKKTLFGLEEEKLLGHIISKDGTKIDPNRVEGILKINPLRNKKVVQSFIGKINFLQRFIPNLAEILKAITDMLKKDTEIKWHNDAKDSFTKNAEGHEQPIAFFSRALRDAYLKFNIMEKQTSALVKALKDFRVYIYTHIITFVPSAVIKDILTQTNPEGKRGKWIATILEYDIEIRPTKLIKGQGLANLMAESNYNVLDINFIAELDEQKEQATPLISEVFNTSPWYADIIFVLQNLYAPPSLTKTKARFLKMKSMKFCILDENLYWKDAGGILLNCLMKDESDRVLEEFHQGDYGGHLYWKSTTNKILRAGFYWSTLLSDVHKKVTSCHQCQIFEGKGKLLLLPLKPNLVEFPFQQWGLDQCGKSRE